MEDVETVLYEQCPFDWEHVARLYPKIPHEPALDGPWVPFANAGGRNSIYRRRGGYFQFVVGDPDGSLFAEMRELEPMETLDDAEWTIEKHDSDAYLVRSKFARTYGPVAETQRLDALLQPHGLWLQNVGTHVLGAATFATLDPSTLLLACRRLVTLEGWCLTANREVEALLNERWRDLRERIAARAERGEPMELALDTPGGKRRVPVPPIARDLLQEP